MYLNHLMWVFGGLFVLFGLSLMFIEPQGGQRIWVSLSVLFLGCFALSMAGDGLVKGEIKLQTSLIKRLTHPGVYWATIILIFFAGVVVIIAAFWAMFFKTW